MLEFYNLEFACIFSSMRLANKHCWIKPLTQNYNHKQDGNRREKPQCGRLSLWLQSCYKEQWLRREQKSTWRAFQELCIIMECMRGWLERKWCSRRAIWQRVCPSIFGALSTTSFIMLGVVQSWCKPNFN